MKHPPTLAPLAAPQGAVSGSGRPIATDMRALLIALLAFVLGEGSALAQSTPRGACTGACGVIQSIAPVAERQVWTPLGSVAPGSLGVAGLSGMTGSSTQMQFGPGFSNQGMVVIGAAGGAVYAQKPNEYRRTRWDVTLKMDDGSTRVVSLSYEPLFVQEGDYVRVAGNNVELVNP
jgi:outer membrane lipoprotein SlyB